MSQPQLVQVQQKGKKYFDFTSPEQNNYRIFLRENKNYTPSFSICIIHEFSPTKSISFKKNFILEEFNEYVKGYKQYNNIQQIQADIINSLLNSPPKISHLDEYKILISLLLPPSFTLSIKATKAHEILEQNELIIKGNKTSNLLSDLQKKVSVNNKLTEEHDKYNQKLEQEINRLEELTKNLFNKIQNYTPPQKQISIPQINGPSEQALKLMSKADRYRILGMESDIVHTVQEVFYISKCLSVERATKLDLLFKGPHRDFSATNFHIDYDDVVPCLVLVEASNGARFGGFTNQTWKGENTYKTDPSAFLFSLDFLEKYPIRPDCVKTAILAKTQRFFTFGKGDLIINDHCNKYKNTSDFPSSFYCPNNVTNPKFRLTRYTPEFGVRDIEVFLVSFKIVAK